MSYDDFSDTWYNHFVTVHGWGLTADRTPYWVIENSWGNIYENDPSLGNNGAGTNYNETVTQLSVFTTIADEVAGRGGLEMTSRQTFFAINQKV
jgi:hypothetical protein